VKIESNLKKKITKMLSEKFSTNPESFKGFGRGRRVDLATSHGYTHNYEIIINKKREREKLG
jgi:hypothetical protein